MLLIALLGISPALVLEVGPGKTFAAIADAVSRANSGDVIRIYPDPSHFQGTHVLIDKPGLSIVGVGNMPVPIDGGGFEYSGTGKVPRAIFQLGLGADGTTLENLDLSGAHNQTFNGAGVRIDGANRATIKHCEIHGNDMGVMSNGRPEAGHSASGQTLSHCRIFGNGNLGEAGYNHNLYLGGESVTLEFCEVFRPLTGHNVKSRAHYTLIQYCSIHDSANREVDLVESRETESPHSNAILMGNLIVKDPACAGNRGVIHFGQEKGKRDGTLFLINNTIVTRFASPVVALDSPANRLQMTNNVIVNPSEAHPTLVARGGGTSIESVQGQANWVSKAYSTPPRLTSPTSAAWPFRSETDLRIGPDLALLVPAKASYSDGIGRNHLAVPAFRYQGAVGWKPSLERFIGAG